MATVQHLLALAVVAGAGALWGQQSVGSVSLNDATVIGSLKVSDGRAQLLGGTTLTAGGHTAEMQLARGGEVKVCATSSLHLTTGKGEAVDGPAPLLLALDRGAVEIHMAVSAKDAIMTPDLRFDVRRSGLLDLWIRVTGNGDTCVENRGSGAPALEIHDQFGDSSYELRAEQHVLFEHGSLKEVVDHESSPCGCPTAPVVSVADAGVSGGSAASPGAAVVAEHPFPAAESQGLVPATASSATAVPQAPAGEVHAQVAASLAYDPSAAGPRVDSLSPAAAPSVPAGNKAASATRRENGSATSASGATSGGGATVPPAVVAQAPAPEAPPSAHDLGHLIGRFFKRLFGRG